MRIPFAVAACVLSLACGNKPPPDTTAPTATVSAGAPTTSSTVSSTPATDAAPNEAAMTDAGPASSTTGDDLVVSTVADPTATLAEAKKQKRGAVLVFCAHWAAACREVDHAFADSDVKKKIEERFLAARVDMSNDESPDVVKHSKAFKVKGVPLIIVYDKTGREVARETAVVDSPALLKLLAKAK